MDALVETAAPRAEAVTPLPAERADDDRAPPAIFAFDGWGMIPLALQDGR